MLTAIGLMFFWFVIAVVFGFGDPDEGVRG